MRVELVLSGSLVTRYPDWVQAELGWRLQNQRHDQKRSSWWNWARDSGSSRTATKQSGGVDKLLESKDGDGSKELSGED